MKVHILPEADTVAHEAAAVIVAEAWLAVRMRGRFILALSGGRTPWQMLRTLAREKVPWDNVHVFQVDERVAPLGHPDRNLTLVHEVLLSETPLREEQIHAMPVESPDLDAAAARYGQVLSDIAGSPPTLDLVHLGLGADGHTASLVPEDPVLDVKTADVSATGVYQGRRRLTMTYPILNRSRKILWIVNGIAKAEMLARLRAGDLSIPAGHVNRERALVLADRAAARAGGILCSEDRAPSCDKEVGN